MNVFRKALENERNVHASLYVGNLDPQVSEPLLYELFIQVGPVKQLNLPKDRVLRLHQGYGFVEFKGSDDADYALDILRGVRLFGRTLKMKKIDPQGTAAAAPEAKSAYSVGARLFVNGLHPLIDEKYLRDTFSAFGNLLANPTVARDDDGKCKGHGIVEYCDFESSDRAIEKMNGTLFMNKHITVAYAFKEGLEHKRVQHGDDAERTLAKQAKLNLRKRKRR